MNIDAKPLEHNRAGQARPCSGRPEIDLLTAQVFQPLDVIARQDVQFRNGQPDDILDAPVQVGRLAHGLEVLEHIGLSDCCVDAVQIEQIVEVARGTVGYGFGARFAPGAAAPGPFRR
ncbi:MAG: hypothetical protein WAM99_06175 [Xanthobacteraceae bacterium]